MMKTGLKRSSSLLFIGLLLFGAVASLVVQPLQVSAVRASDWKAGKIIEDSIFYSSQSMTVEKIQAFLNSAVPNCDTWGELPSEFGGGTRAQYGAAVGNPAPFVCLRDYIENPTTKENNLRTAGSVSGGWTAAQIIKHAADQYRVSPKSLIALIQKEQALITDSWPLVGQYRSATGYGCPDTAACDSTYYGFYNQVINAAKQFRLYADHPASYRYKPYQDNAILYNPVASCGSSTVYIQNLATAGLYNYTPYQPNQAALNNLYGTGDSCSAYGNRNFWRLYNDWFGSTYYIEWSNLQDPRWMELKANLQKVDPSTAEYVGDQLTKGQQIKFTTKTVYRNESCLRTEHDTKYDQSACIPLSSLKEVEPIYTPLNGADKIKSIKEDTYKLDIRRGVSITSNPLAKHKQLEFAATTTVGGKLYYVTKHDYTNGFFNGVPASVVNASVAYSDISPTWLQLTDQTHKQSPLLGGQIDSILAKYSIITFTSRVKVNNTWYYRTKHDTEAGLDKAISENKLSSDIFRPFQYPRWMIVDRDTYTVDPYTGALSNTKIPAGTVIYFVSKANTSNGKVYYRSQSDTNSNVRAGVDSQDVSELNYSEFLYPRWMEVSKDTYIINPFTKAQISPVSAGQHLKFSTKISINGKTYYRTENASSSSADQVISADSLKEIGYQDFLFPRSLKVSQQTYKHIPSQGVPIESPLNEDMVIKFRSKININGVLYYRTEHDSSYNFDKAIPAADLTEL